MKVKTRTMQRCYFAWGLCMFALGDLALTVPTFGQKPLAVNLMPMPARIQPGTDSLQIGAGFSVSLTGHTEPRLDRAVDRFLKQFSRQTGIPLTPESRNVSKATLAIHTDHASDAVQQLGEDESYVLIVAADGVRLSAPTPLGTMHGLSTLLQLVTASPSVFEIPAVSIHDSPRFPWRGLMIDASRHFIPLDVIRRNLDGMERVKMNVFHWHLSDNQGFRVESKRLPKLQEMGSDGLFYTQEEIREIIAYARDRGIRVVPEFDLPGHSTAWLVGYPEIASGSGPYEIERRWGVFDPAVDPTKEGTYKFLDRFIEEMAGLFPDRFFHVGGDEVNGKEWDRSAKIQEFKRGHGISDNRALQAYFNRRLQSIVNKHGKTMIGWDEILDPSLPEDITIQSWRGAASLADAAKRGYRGLLSSGWYLDLGWPAARHYEVDPMGETAAALSADEKARILGGEACVWTEYMNSENIDSRIWPRGAAIAERLWSPQELRDPASMYSRMRVVSEQLEWLGLTHRSYYRPMLQRIAGPAAPDEFAALRTLADVVEPVKDYKREQTAPAVATSATPLNRIVDAVAPESDSARFLGELVDKFVQSGCGDSQLEIALRAQFTGWRDNDAKFRTLAQSSFLAREAMTTSQDLAAISKVGLAALDSVDKGTAPPAEWKEQQLAVIQRAEEPKSQLLLVPAASVAKLIDGVTSAACKARASGAN